MMGCLAELALRMALWVILLPVLLVANTSVILVCALFGDEPYRSRVRRGYEVVINLWGYLS